MRREDWTEGGENGADRQREVRKTRMRRMMMKWDGIEDMVSRSEGGLVCYGCGKWRRREGRRKERARSCDVWAGPWRKVVESVWGGGLCDRERTGELLFCRGFVFCLGWIGIGFGKERAGTGSIIY